jgi:hypothetical protein
MLSEIFHFIEFMFVFTLVLIALFVVLLVVVSKMPHDNPLRMILSALSHRVGVTGGLMIVDPVATGIPVVGELFDVVTLIFLVYYWYTFFRQLPAMRAAWNAPAPPPHWQPPPTPPLPRRPPPPEIEHR